MGNVELCELNAVYSHTESSSTRGSEVIRKIQANCGGIEVVDVSGESMHVLDIHVTEGKHPRSGSLGGLQRSEQRCDGGCGLSTVGGHSDTAAVSGEGGLEREAREEE